MRAGTLRVSGGLLETAWWGSALQGADDPYGTPEQLRVPRTHVRTPVSINLIPDARYAPHLEAKDATLAAITTFIAALGNSPT